MKLLPFLNLRDANTGRCFQVFDNCATIAAVRRAPGWVASREANCDECCPSCDDPGDLTGIPVLDGLWWADPLSPAAGEALGILVSSMDLETATSARRLGESSSDAPGYLPRQLVVRGRLLANSYAGVYHLQTSLVAALTNPCGACDGWEASVRLFCPELDPDDDLVLPEAWIPAEPEPVDWADCVSDDCPEAEPLAAPGPTPTRTDTGIRTILNARFQHFDTDEEVESPIEGCYGSDFVMVFEIWEDYEYGDVIGGLCAERPLVADNLEDCKPHDFTHCLWLPELDLCDTSTGDGRNVADVEAVRPTTARNLNYCQPLLRTVRSCLTPVLPVGSAVAPMPVIETGVTPLANFRMEIHPAYTGVPAPETCEGEKFYRSHAPCGVVMIGGAVPANSRIEIDGRRKQVLLYCVGGEAERAEDIIEGWTFPTLDPACRYWVTTIADCANTAPDATVDVFYSPRFQS